MPAASEATDTRASPAYVFENRYRAQEYENSEHDISNSLRGVGMGEPEIFTTRVRRVGSSLRRSISF